MNRIAIALALLGLFMSFGCSTEISSTVSELQKELDQIDPHDTSAVNELNRRLRQMFPQPESAISFLNGQAQSDDPKTSITALYALSLLAGRLHHDADAETRQLSDKIDVLQLLKQAESFDASNLPDNWSSLLTLAVVQFKLISACKGAGVTRRLEATSNRPRLSRNVRNI